MIRMRHAYAAPRPSVLRDAMERRAAEIPGDCEAGREREASYVGKIAPACFLSYRRRPKDLPTAERERAVQGLSSISRNSFCKTPTYDDDHGDAVGVVPTAPPPQPQPLIVTKPSCRKRDPQHFPENRTIPETSRTGREGGREGGRRGEARSRKQIRSGASLFRQPWN